MISKYCTFVFNQNKLVFNKIYCIVCIHVFSFKQNIFNLFNTFPVSITGLPFVFTKAIMKILLSVCKSNSSMMM